MSSHDPDQDKHADKQADRTLMQKVKALQEHMRKIGVFLEGSDDKVFMDEAWCEDSGDVKG